MTEPPCQFVEFRQLVIVDPHLDDYLCLAPSSEDALAMTNNRIRYTLTSTGSTALRLATAYPSALWVINKRLPDMDGLQLLDMLQSLLPGATTIVLDDQHSLQNEQLAHVLGADHYLTKPFQLEWVDSCRSSRQADGQRVRDIPSAKSPGAPSMWGPDLPHRSFRIRSP